MEIDLELHQAHAATFHSEICIVGAGIAGLTLAHRLSQQGIDVALIEAGGHTGKGAGQGFFAQAELSGEPHIGTTQGRFRAFGGSSLRWGGQLLPLPSQLDAFSSGTAEHESPSGIKVECPQAAPDSWPLRAADLARHYRDAERLLGVDDLPYHFPSIFEHTHTTPPAILEQLPELIAMFSKLTPFSRRNMADSIGSSLLASRNTSVYLNAQVTELLLSPARTHIAAVLVRTLAGNVFRFEARGFILAAGTVETSRLLLASRSIAPEGVGNAHDQVGRNFHDHVTLPAATLTGPARATLLRELGFWIFAGGGRGTTVHSAKLFASARLCERLGLNPVLAHLTIEEPEGSGLATVRELLIAFQRGDLPSGLASHAAHLPGAVGQALRLAWSARLLRRRFVSAHAAITLRLNAAQDTPSLSRITLSDRLDSKGVLEPNVNWRITARELSTLRSFARYLRERFTALHLEGFNWLPELFIPDAPLPSIEDARHAMGGACMGTDPRTSVVSPDLGVHGVANLSIASAATFPTGSPQLPTLPLMALSLRLADQIALGLRH